VTWLAAAVAVTALDVWRKLRHTDPALGVPDPVEAERRLAGLAVAVEAARKPQQGRRLFNPYPLPTAGTTVGPPVGDYWANIRADGVNEPLGLSGQPVPVLLRLSA